MAEADIVLHAAVDRVIEGANPSGHRIKTVCHKGRFLQVLLRLHLKEKVDTNFLNIRRI